MDPKPYNANKLVIVLIVFLTLFNIAMVMILNDLSFKGTAERYVAKYLQRQGYAYVYIKAFVLFECECKTNGGYSFEAIDYDGLVLNAKACSDGYGGFWVYASKGCIRIDTPLMRMEGR